MAKKKKNPLVTAGTLLPLALGLGMNAAGPTKPAAHARGGGTARGAPLTISCTLPFASIERPHPIDDACPASGNSPAGSPQAMQNQAKNNFCAAADKPVNIDFDVLHQLQQDVSTNGISFGSDPQLPKDRSLLRQLPTKAGSIGEGTVVRLAAFVINAHASNVGSGESVNCKRPDAESNDIHIVLGQNSNQDDECSSVTAEMSPHFRPDIWDPTTLNQNNAHLYRFTGQLFFDASHRPCTGGTGPNPKRSSLWEIHPVYAVDICTDASNNCVVDSDANWVSLSDFVGAGTPSPETRLRMPVWLPGELRSTAAPSQKRWLPQL